MRMDAPLPLPVQPGYKDRRTGLIDFPSEMDGRRVLLCWRLGEESVQYWHDEQSGFAGRQPLSTTLVG